MRYFVKTKEFRNFNCMLQALKIRGGELLSYIDYGTFIKANIRYEDK